jgi:hypothetical protein
MQRCGVFGAGLCVESLTWKRFKESSVQTISRKAPTNLPAVHLKANRRYDCKKEPLELTGVLPLTTIRPS